MGHTLHRGKATFIKPGEMNKTEKDGLVFAAASVFAWGLTGVFVRLLPGFSGLFITGFRFLLALLVALPFVLLDSDRRAHLVPALRNGTSWSLGTALVLYYFLAVSAYKYGTVGEVALFLGTAPVFVIVTKALRGLRVDRKEKIGAAMAMFGVALVLAPKLSTSGGISGARLLGIALAILSAAASAHYTKLSSASRKNGDKFDPVAISVIAFAIGAALPLTASALLGQISIAALHGPTLRIFAALAVISTALPSITYAVAARSLRPTVTTTIQLMIPVIATIAAAAILHERPSLWLVPGGSLVLFGIVHMFREPAPAPAPARVRVGEIPEFAGGD